MTVSIVEFLLLSCAVNFTTFLSMHMYVRVVTCIIVIVLEHLDLITVARGYN